MHLGTCCVASPNSVNFQKSFLGGCERFLKRGCCFKNREGPTAGETPISKNNIKTYKSQGKVQDQLVSGRRLESDSQACNATTGDITSCAEWIYGNVELIGTPGQVYSYNSNHLQLAAAVAVAATGMQIHDVIDKYLLRPYNMRDSFYYGKKCPDFGVDLMTTGTDYERFMQGLLGYTTLPKAIVDASEEDATPFMSSYYSLYGDYGFGHFLMCFDSVNGFTAECAAARCHMGPGALGFLPIIDRRYNYYMEVVAAEIPPTGSYPLSGIPEYLAVAIKPHVDAIMSGKRVNPAEFSHHEAKYLSMSVADVNYCLDCKLHPDRCS